MRLSIVATLYQSVAYIAEFHQRASSVAQQLVGDDYEIIFVNDDSPDNSLDIAVQLIARDQRCWVHKTANVLNYLPRSVQAKAKSMLHEIWMAEGRADAQSAFDPFVATFRAKYPKATEWLAKDWASLLAFYDFPAEHWIHIRTSNPSEFAFATIRHRTDRTKGCVSRSTLLGLVYRLGMSAQTRWRRLRGFERLGELIAGVKFVDGVRAQPRTRQNQSVQQVAA